MARVRCTILEVDLPNERGGTQPGVRAECMHCSHTTESFGTGEKSIKRCLILMREQCPEDEANFYVED